MSESVLSVGKLPMETLARLLARAPTDDPALLLGPGIGLDCAVVEHGGTLLVLKSDPITFVTEDMGRYLVQVNANDVATTGATPRWLLLTLLLPASSATEGMAEQIMEEVCAACRQLDITLVGGHTEVTHGLAQPIAVGALIGEVERSGLVTPRGARPGDRILLTKGVPIEGTSILARQFRERLRGVLSEDELEQARRFLVEPGISVVRDARVALQSGAVNSMHDPTEGGLAAALWELAEASDRSLLIEPGRVPVPELSARICRVFGIDPLATIASGALLMTVRASAASGIRQALEEAGVPCTDIGEVCPGPKAVFQHTPSGTVPLPCPAQDGIALVYAE